MVGNCIAAAAVVENEPVRISNSLDQIFQDAGFTALARELRGEGGHALLQKVQDGIRKSSTSDALVEALAKVEAPILAGSILGLFGVTPGMTEDDFLSKCNEWNDRKISTRWENLLTSHRGSPSSGGHEKSFFNNVKNLIEGFKVQSDEVIEQVITDRAFAFLHDVKADFNKWKREEALEPVFKKLKELIGDGWSESLAVPQSGRQENESSKVAPLSDVDAAVRLVLEQLENDSGDSIADQVNDLFPLSLDTSDRYTPPALFFSKLFFELDSTKVKDVDTRKASIVKMAIERGAIEDVKVFVEKETQFVADHVIDRHSENFIHLTQLLKDSPQSLKGLSDNLICRAHSSEELNPVFRATPLTLWTDLSDRAISNIRKVWRFDGVAEGEFRDLQRRVRRAVAVLSTSREARDRAALNNSGENAQRAEAAKDLVSRILSPHPAGNGDSWSALKTKLARVCTEIVNLDNYTIGSHQTLNDVFLDKVRQIEAFKNLELNWQHFVIESCRGVNLSKESAEVNLQRRIKLLDDCVQSQEKACELLKTVSAFTVSLSTPGTVLFDSGFNIRVSEENGPLLWLNVINISDARQFGRREDNPTPPAGLVAMPACEFGTFNIYLQPQSVNYNHQSGRPESVPAAVLKALNDARRSLDRVLGYSKKIN